MTAGRYLEDFGGQYTSDFGPLIKGDGLVSVSDRDLDPQFHATLYDRGGLRSNLRVSLGTTEAGAHLTRGNLHWDGAGAVGQPLTITFGFRSTAPGSIPNDYSGFSRFTDAQIAATLLSLSAWSDVANITFQRLGGSGGEDNYTNNAAILFGNFLNGSQEILAFGASPGSRDSTSGAGDIWANSARVTIANPTVLDSGQRALTHAAGVALGLQSPGTDYYENSQQYSITSSSAESTTGARFGPHYSAVPMLDDIAAIQRLYGANLTTRTGDTVYGFNSTAGRPWFAPGASSNAMIFVVWDAGGVDTLDFSGYAVDQSIFLAQTSFSNVGGLVGNVAIALGTVIENAVGGSGNDDLIGNSGDNVLTGNAGSDFINGGLGRDTAVFVGPRSDYTISLIANGEWVSVAHATEGTDILVNVEFLQFSDQTVASGTVGGVIVEGDILDNAMDGTEFTDTLIGHGGNDRLAGFGGDDVLEGGSGNDTISGGDGNDRIKGGYGDDVLSGGAGFDRVDYSEATGGVQVNLMTGIATGSEGRDTLVGFEEIYGTVFNDILIGNDEANTIAGYGGGDTLIGGGGDDRLIGTSLPSSRPLGATMDGGDGNDTLLGTTAADILIGGTGSDSLSGNLGIDTAVYSGVRRQYGVSGLVAAPFTVWPTISGGPEGGMDTLLNVEQCRFVDGILSFDVNGIPAQVMRLYDATLDRQPDQAGLDTYIQAMSSGSTTMLALAAILVDSPEFQARYGTLSNQQFVEQLYRFSLDRAGDPQGIAHYVDALNTGTSRAALVVNFSESPEHRRLTQPILDAGLWVADQTAMAVARLYNAAFDRLPDVAGLAGYIEAMNTGNPLLAIAEVFVASPEFQARYGSLTNQAFVEQLYRSCLDREGDSGGIAGYLAALEAGTSRAALLVHFSESPEHVALTSPLWSGGVRTIDPAFSASLTEGASEKAIKDQPLEVFATGDRKTAELVEEIQPALTVYDPVEIMSGFNITYGDFVLPSHYDPEPLVLIDHEGKELLPMPSGEFTGLTGDRMLLLPVNDDDAVSDAMPWHRAGNDDWMMLY